MQNRIFRSIGALTFVIVCSAVIPSTLLFLQSAVTPHFDPVAFGMPITAVEVVSKRTEKAVTFEISPGKFASVSAGERLASPSCDRATLSTLCRVVTHVRRFVPSAFATSSGPLSPDTVTDDATIGTVSWNNPNNAKVSDNVYVSSGMNGSPGLIDHEVKIVKSDGSIGTTNMAIIPTDYSASDAYSSYGSAVDLWGETWTYANINHANFGVVYSATNGEPEIMHYLKATNFGFAIPTGGTINGIVVEIEKSKSFNNPRIDHMRMTVYYTEAAGAAPFFSWWSLPLMFAGCGWVLWKEGYFGGEARREQW